MKGLTRSALGVMMFLVSAISYADIPFNIAPKGEVKGPQTVMVRFDNPVISLGQIDAPNPFVVSCEGTDIQGVSKWVDASVWQYDFDKKLPAGVFCKVNPNPDFKDLNGNTFADTQADSFYTGAPTVTSVYPYQEVDPEQIFIVKFDAEVNVNSLAENAVCVIEGVGEQIPIRVLDNDTKEKLIKESEWIPASGNSYFVQCSRSFPDNAKVSLVIKSGLRSQTGIPSLKAFTHNFITKGPFTVDLQCERNSEKEPCSPFGDVYLSFSGFVSKEDVQKIHFLIDGKAYPAKKLESNFVKNVEYEGPFPAKGNIEINIPKELTDDAGRRLSNANKLPLRAGLSEYPALLKFATGDFGIIERYADAKGDVKTPALIPLTVRNVENKIAIKGGVAANVRQVSSSNDLVVRRWIKKLPLLSHAYLNKHVLDAVLNGRKVDYDDYEEGGIDTRTVSVLAGNKGAENFDVPRVQNGKNETEVIGIPVKKSGFYVLEAQSPLLGKELVEGSKPMYVRTAVLVTNMAVHLKIGKSGAAIWVTSLEDASVIPDADVRLSGCNGEEIAKGKTNKDGMFIYKGKIPNTDSCSIDYHYMASATIPASHPMANGEGDYSFAMSNWDDGIEPWRFNLGDDAYGWYESNSPIIMHAVLGRTLLRAGETIHMKHYAREKTSMGVKALNPKLSLPKQLSIKLEALDQEVKLPLDWKKASNGNVYAETKWTIPKEAKNGLYQVEYINGKSRFDSGASFRVEEFKLPMLKGNIALSSSNQVGSVLINPKEIKASIQINYMTGGGAAQLPVTVSAMYVPDSFDFEKYEDTDFSAIERPDSYERKIFLDKQAAKLDVNGNVTIDIGHIPTIYGKGNVLVEVSFMDPNGQVQTISQNVDVSSSAVIAGIRGRSYFEPKTDFTFDVIAVDPLGKPQADKKIKVDAKRYSYNAIRKRLVGGFYSVEYHNETEDLGEVCEGETDEFGVLKCTANIAYEGELILSARVVDKQSNVFASKSSLWVYKGASWYSGNDTDRVDVVSDKAQYKVGEKAIFDVRMPFKEATALVSVERDNVVEYQIVKFKENSSTFELTVKEDWSPNVYVSVLSVRGRIRADVDDEGKAWVKDGSQANGASVLIDLAKPSFRFGVAGIKVVNPSKQLALSLSLDKPKYQVRDKVKLSISGQTGDGEKAAKANVAVFVVDKALLELSKNNTTNLYDTMFKKRSWQVETATAQGEVVGRRHYGRKAIPAGGGGGLAPTRELFDALAFWKADVELDEKGQANVEFTLNDSVTEFEVVAVADYGADAFGTQVTHLKSIQDVQIISGLPQVIRDADSFRAVLTIHNASDEDMRIEVQGKGTKYGQEFKKLESQTVSVEAGHSHQVFWEIDPIALDGNEVHQTITWEFEASEKSLFGNKTLRDHIKVTQTLLPYVPVTVRQSQLLRVDAANKTVSLPVQAPIRALSANNKIRGGIQVKLQKSLVNSLDGVINYFENYPYSCAEQQASMAIGLNSEERWNTLMQSLPSYMDDDGLVDYFPGRNINGSPLLTAYLLSASFEARQLGLNFEIPKHLQNKMLKALSLRAQGKIKDSDWRLFTNDPNYELKVIEALVHYNAATPAMLEKFADLGDYSPTSLISLYVIYSKLGGANKTSNLKILQNAILAKMDHQSDRLVFGSIHNNLWWLMDSAKTLQARLLLAVVNDPLWEKEIPYIVQGLIKLQDRGQWGTTTGNLWGLLAVKAFSQAFEQELTEGYVSMTLEGGGYAKPEKWNGLRLNQEVLAPWIDKQSAQLDLSLEGKGTVWATVSALAAVNPVENTYAGYRIEKTIEPISNRKAGQWSVGDVYRVKLRIVAKSPMTWVVVNDPIPSGATILGGGLGRDSVIQNDVSETSWYSRPTFVERKSDVFRAYYRFMRSGEVSLEYTVRLNNFGKFSMPPTHVHGMYSPGTFGEYVNTDIQVKEP